MKRKLLEKLRLLSLLLVAGLVSWQLQAADINSGLKLHYTFEQANGTTLPDVSGNGYNGTLHGATVGMSNGKPSLLLGTSGADYVDMGANTGNLIASLNDFSISVYVFVNTTNTNLSANGNFICKFANSENTAVDQNGIIFLQAKRSRFAISPTHWGGEQFTQTGLDVVKGEWVHMTYTQAGTVGRLYINGEHRSTNPNVTLKPSDIGATPYNFLGKATFAGDINLQDAQLADFRIYDRAISQDEILILNGYPAELIDAYSALTMPDLNEVRSNLTLPTTSGTANLPVVWESSLPEIISITGEVNRPERFDVTVILTATVSMENNGTVYTLKKEFTAIVKAFAEMDEIIAYWNFDADNIFVEDGVMKIKDATENEFVATLKNEARIRTIGVSEQFNVLDLGNGTGYLDLGAEIGEAIYALNDFTIAGYFRIDESYGQLTSNGNFLWTFSNTPDAPTDRNGYLLGRLNNMSYEITPGYYASGNQGIYAGRAAPQGQWHHIAYTQKGSTGRLYLDGEQVATGTITNLPSIVLPKPGLKGTNYNWIGRANYPSDVYLRQTLVYGFQIYTIELTQDNLLLDIEMPYILSRLNAAYAENPDFISEAVTNEAANLTLPDLSALTSDISLPTQGTLDPSVEISWTSSHPQLISNTGQVSRPDYFNFNVTLTATLSKGAQSVSKDFPATVLVKPGTEFANSLIVKYDFSDVEGRIVYDKGEKRFYGTTVNDATIRKIGSEATGFYNVLDLGNGTGYFDMGEDLGKAMYHLDDFTVAGFYRIDPEYENLTANGNFLWTFSNSTNSAVDRNGYFFGRLGNLSISISPTFWEAAAGNQALAFNEPALQGNWHHFAYTQNQGLGTIYLDGMGMIVGDIPNSLKDVLVRPGRLGTLYNWIGRPNFAGDAYLLNTLVHDFRVYSRALSDIEILQTELDVMNKLANLDAAYEANSNVESGLHVVKSGPYQVVSENGVIRINGLTGTENIAVFDITGRRITSTNRNEIHVGSGIYIIRIDQYTTKIIAD